MNLCFFSTIFFFNTTTKSTGAGRLLDSPRHAARFVSLIPYTKVDAVGAGSGEFVFFEIFCFGDSTIKIIIIFISLSNLTYIFTLSMVLFHGILFFFHFDYTKQVLEEWKYGIIFIHFYH